MTRAVPLSPASAPGFWSDSVGRPYLEPVQLPATRNPWSLWRGRRTRAAASPPVASAAALRPAQPPGPVKLGAVPRHSSLCRRRFQGVRNRCVCVARGAGTGGAGAVPGPPEASLTRQPETRARGGSCLLGCERLLGRQTRFLFQHAFFKVHRGAAALSPRERHCCI